MERSSSSDGLEELLAQRAWVRRVARALVLDDSRADDLEQEAWVGALRGVKPGSPRAWLGTVLRRAASNMRRAEGRRTVHEAAAPPPAPLPSPEEMVERAEVVERVWRAVRGLAEPYRAAVLLRYFEDIPPAVIGERLGVPVETVRTRLRRALVMLRERLDEEEGGDRRRWAVLLLPFARPSVPWAPQAAAGGSALAVAVEVLFMTLKTKTAAAAAVLLFLGGAAWWAMRPEGPPSSGPAAREPSVATVPPDRTVPLPAEATASAAVPASAGARLSLRVIDTAGRPVAAARATVEPLPLEDQNNPWRQEFLEKPPGSAVSAEAASAADGTASLPGIAVGRVRLRVTGAGFAVHQEEIHVARAGEEIARTVVLLPSWTLAGTVFGADGAPLPGAEVLAAGCSAMSADGGRYRLEGLPPGTHEVSVRAGGALFKDLAFVVVPGLKSLDLRLEGGCALEGRVLDDAAGTPIAGARVFLLATLVSGYPRMVNFTREAVSGADGFFRIDGVPPANADMLEVEAEGFLRMGGWNASVFPPNYRFARGDRLRVEVRLRRGSVLRGRISRPDGSPVAGAVVEAFPVPALGDPTTKGTSGSDGVYEFRAWPGAGLLRVRAPGLVQPGIPEDPWAAVGSGSVPDACRVDVAAEGATTRDVVLEEEKPILPGTAVLAGTVRRADGVPLVLAYMRVYAPGRIERLAAVTGEGAFRFDGLPAGNHSLEARAEGCPAAWTAVEGLGDGEQRTGLEIVLAAGWDLEGRVVDREGAPLPGATVRAVPMAKRWEDHPVAAVSDADGSFTVLGLLPGEQYVAVGAPGFAEDSRTVAPGGGVVEFALKRCGSIAGRVVEEDTGKPVAGILVWANRSAFSGGTVRIRETLTDAGGRFEIGGLEPAEYDLCTGRLADPGPTGEFAPAKVEAVKVGTTDARISLKRGLPIAGRVLDGEDRPVEGGSVDLNGPEGGPAVFQRAAIGRDGSFRIPGLPAGHYALQVAPGGGLAPQRISRVAAGTTDLVVRAGAALAIRGRVLHEDGTPLPYGAGGFDIRWKNADGTATRTGLPMWEADGSFQTQPLDPERLYDLVVYGRPGLLGGAARGVRPGTKDLVITVAVGGSLDGRVVDEDGRPAPRISITASGRGLQSPWAEPGSHLFATTDDQGAFRLKGMASVPYDLSAGGTPTDFLPFRTSEPVAPGTTEVVLKLQRGSVLSGKVVDASGQSLPEGFVQVERGGALCRVGKDGAFEVRGIRPGECTLYLRLGQRVVELGKATAPAENLVLTVPGE